MYDTTIRLEERFDVIELTPSVRVVTVSINHVAMVNKRERRRKTSLAWFSNFRIAWLRLRHG